jgi:hypothetical protein
MHTARVKRQESEDISRLRLVEPYHHIPMRLHGMMIIGYEQVAIHRILRSVRFLMQANLTSIIYGCGLG